MFDPDPPLTWDEEHLRLTEMLKSQWFFPCDPEAQRLAHASRRALSLADLKRANDTLERHLGDMQSLHW